MQHPEKTYVFTMDIGPMGQIPFFPGFSPPMLNLIKCIMKKMYLSAAFLAVTLLLISAFTSQNNVQALTPGNDVTVGPFSSIGISIPAKVTLEQAPVHKLSIDADEATLEQIEAKVENGELVIKCKAANCRLKGDVEIHISVSELKELGLAGSVEVDAPSEFNAGELSVKIAGSGSVSFADLKASEMMVKISGSGKVVLEGEGAANLSVSIAGSGNVNAQAFRVENYQAKISGSGDCTAWVEGKLTVSIAGSGSVKYKGKAVVNSSVAGSGKVEGI
jgi:hypothetical protein